jgi:hypothetical protein
MTQPRTRVIDQTVPRLPGGTSWTSIQVGNPPRDVRWSASASPSGAIESFSLDYGNGREVTVRPPMTGDTVVLERSFGGPLNAGMIFRDIADASGQAASGLQRGPARTSLLGLSADAGDVADAVAPRPPAGPLYGPGERC